MSGLTPTGFGSNMRRRTGRVIGLLAAASIASAAAGQAQRGSGHALDANLRVGSSGYNDSSRRGGPLASPAYAPAYSKAKAAASGSGVYAGVGRKYSAYTGGALQERDRITNYDTYLNDKSYSAGWQSRSGGYSSYSSPGGTRSGSAGAYRIDTRRGG